MIFRGCLQSVEVVPFDKGADDVLVNSKEPEKKMILRTCRLMYVLRVRLLRSIRCVKMFPVSCISRGTTMA